MCASEYWKIAARTIFYTNKLWHRQCKFFNDSMATTTKIYWKNDKYKMKKGTKWQQTSRDKLTYIETKWIDSVHVCVKTLCAFYNYTAPIYASFPTKKNNKRSKHNIHENSFRVSVVVLVDFRTFYHKSTTACSYNTSYTHILLLWVENYADIYQTHLRPRWLCACSFLCGLLAFGLFVFFFNYFVVNAMLFHELLDYTCRLL